MTEAYEIVIAGSGFAGSLLARILQSGGRKVALVDSTGHPRFSIGESSTPIADLLLDRIGQQYGLNDLQSMSNFGGWKRSFPHIACGKKRGFSYFDHRHHWPETEPGASSLLVAASPSDERSDTHWYRSEVDAHWYRLATQEGVEGIECDAIEFLEIGQPNRIRLASGRELRCRFLVDATGRTAVSARLLNRPSLTHRLSTNTSAAFGHFVDVDSFSNWYKEVHNDHCCNDPFDADDAAQHHLVDDGWVWMLRFENGITSVGWVTNNEKPGSGYMPDLLGRLSQYRGLKDITAKARLVAPHEVVSASRLQSLYDPIVSESCFLLPSAALTLDPLHSTGIAHGLIGIARMAKILLGDSQTSELLKYRESFFQEAIHLDRLVSCAYRSMRSFKRFSAACSLYFLAAIRCEEALIAGEQPDALWLASDRPFLEAAEQAIAVLDSDKSDNAVTDSLRHLLRPWNDVGLLDSSTKNRYAYTATK